MKRIFLKSCALMLMAFVIISANNRRSSSGAPASHTGAPDEETCAESGCHDDNKINSGTASLQVSLDADPHKIIPGHTYPVKIRIIDENVSRFGFQVVALDSDKKDQGTFSLADSLRTQFIKNEYKLTNRKYVTYTFSGTDAVSKGVGEWIVNWTAPSDLKKSVTFYVAGVSANDDMSDKGDKVYTKSLTINN